MAQCMPSLNPPKTLKPKIPFTNPSLSSISSFKTRPKSKKFMAISASDMSSQSQNQDHPRLSLDSLINSSRKDELLDPIKSSLSHCLSETNLHLTVPGLKSKTRGKVESLTEAKTKTLLSIG
jgi:phosphoribosylaminoimidazole-succinocarboxamide synthase